MQKVETASSWLALSQCLIINIVDTSNIINEFLAKATKFLARSSFKTVYQHIKILLLFGASMYPTGRMPDKIKHDFLVMCTCLQFAMEQEQKIFHENGASTGT
jgi:hypothetical protein